MVPEKQLACPVCSAPFREKTTCSRCKADLEPIMQIAGKARVFRDAARTAVLVGDFERAGEHAHTSLALHETKNGRNLLLLARWLCSLRRKNAP